MIDLLNAMRQNGFSDEEIIEAAKKVYPNGFATARRIGKRHREDEIGLEDMVKEYPLWFKAIFPHLAQQLQIDRCIMRVNRLRKTIGNDFSIKLALSFAVKDTENNFFLDNETRELDDLIVAHPTHFLVALDSLG